VPVSAIPWFVDRSPHLVFRLCLANCLTSLPKIAIFTRLTDHICLISSLTSKGIANSSGDATTNRWMADTGTL